MHWLGMYSVIGKAFGWKAAQWLGMYPVIWLFTDWKTFQWLWLEDPSDCEFVLCWGRLWLVVSSVIGQASCDGIGEWSEVRPVIGNPSFDRLVYGSEEFPVIRTASCDSADLWLKDFKVSRYMSCDRSACLLWSFPVIGGFSRWLDTLVWKESLWLWMCPVIGQCIDWKILPRVCGGDVTCDKLAHCLGKFPVLVDLPTRLDNLLIGGSLCYRACILWQGSLLFKEISQRLWMYPVLG